MASYRHYVQWYGINTQRSHLQQIVQAVWVSELIHWRTQQPKLYIKKSLTHWPLGDLDAILKLQFLILSYWLVSSHQLKMPWDECQWTSAMINQHWFRKWLGAIRQQAITWSNVDLVPCRHMASSGHNELKSIPFTHNYWIMWNRALRPTVQHTHLYLINWLIKGCAEWNVEEGYVSDNIYGLLTHCEMDIHSTHWDHVIHLHHGLEQWGQVRVYTSMNRVMICSGDRSFSNQPSEITINWISSL